MPWPSIDLDANRSGGVPMGVLLAGWAFGVVVALAAVLLLKLDLGPMWVVVPGLTALATARWWRQTHTPLPFAAAAPMRQGFWPSKDPADYRGRGISSPPVPALPLVIGWSGGPLLAWGFTSGYNRLALAAGFVLLNVAVGVASWRVRGDRVR